MTRYPKAGKGAKWTIKELDAIPSELKGSAISDGEGLLGEVRVDSLGGVSIAFRYGFKWEGKKTWFYCGSYPTTAMSEIRDERDRASKLLKQGIDPRAHKKAERIEAQAAIESALRAEEAKRTEVLTFRDMFDCWLRDGVSRSDGNKYITQSFSKHALPYLGATEIKKLNEGHLRSRYREIIESGKTPTAVELSKDIGQMLRWAEKRQPWRALLINGNPAELVEINKLVPPTYTKERDRILSIEEIQKLESVFDGTGQAYANAPKKYGKERPLKKEVQLAMWICLGTVCRIGELLMTEWKHINFEERTWFIPAANTKGVRGRKRDFVVYLSDFTLDKFRQLNELTGDTPWAFPARYKEGHVCVKSASKQIGDRQVKFKQRTKKLKFRVENNTLVLGEREWTPHDLRRTGATMIQNIYGGAAGKFISDLCLNHVVITGSAKHYLLDDYAGEKREAWQRLGDRLEGILNATNVVSLKTA